VLSVIYVTIRPFPPEHIDDWRVIWEKRVSWEAVAVLIPNVKSCLTGDSDVSSPIGTSVLVCNHVMDGDWWAILMLGRCIGLWGGIKVFFRSGLFGSSRSPNPSMVNSLHRSLRNMMNMNMNEPSSINRFGLPSVNSSTSRRHLPSGLNISSSK
jgi:hypothetical protein